MAPLRACAGALGALLVTLRSNDMNLLRIDGYIQQASSASLSPPRSSPAGRDDRASEAMAKEMEEGMPRATNGDEAA